MQRLHVASLKAHARKFALCADYIEYLGFIITRKGIKPSDKKVQVMLTLERPKSSRDVSKFLGIVQ